jgi:hypothetical protein
VVAGPADDATQDRREEVATLDDPAGLVLEQLEPARVGRQQLQVVARERVLVIDAQEVADDVARAQLEPRRAQQLTRAVQDLQRRADRDLTGPGPAAALALALALAERDRQHRRPPDADLPGRGQAVELTALDERP